MHRVFVFNEPALQQELLENRVRGATLVQSQKDWDDALKQALVLVMNPNTENPDWNPMVFLAMYRELVRGILMDKEPPPLEKRPWQPATLVRCDPKAIPKRSGMFRWNKQPQDMEKFSIDVTIDALAATVRRALARKIVAEKYAFEKKRKLVLASWHCPKEPYLKEMLRG
ncbi:MAG TPA: hypothetical protein VI873_00965 [Candidatus Peribacteraceae bacterium]|nr:hypothetical protein [Candidatus Peribacteraceae bacterium]